MEKSKTDTDTTTYDGQSFQGDIHHDLYISIAHVGIINYSFGDGCASAVG